MSIEAYQTLDTTRKAGADLSAKQFYWVKLNSSGDVVLCNGATDKPYGILQDKPLSGQGCVVQRCGISKVSAAASNTPGNVGGTDANGQFAAYVFGTDTTKYIPAEVVESAGAANGLCSVSFSCYCPPRGA
jgi:hypothetical protein